LFYVSFVGLGFGLCLQRAGLGLGLSLGTAGLGLGLCLEGAGLGLGHGLVKAQFEYNPDVILQKIGADGWTAENGGRGRTTDKHNAFAAYCWHGGKNEEQNKRKT